MPNTPEPILTNVEDLSDLPPLLEGDVSEPETPTPPQQVYVTYWANAPHPAPTVVSMSCINEHEECVVVPVPVNAVEKPIVRMKTDNTGVQFTRQNNF